MARKKFQYRDNDPEVAKKHASRKGDYDRPINDKFPMFKPKEGKNRIRILPRTWGDDEGPKHWAYPLYLHYEVGPDNGAYPCLSKMGKGACPVCEERTRLDSSGDGDSAKNLRASLTMLCWIVDRNNEDEGPQIFRMPAKKLEGPICELSRDDDTGEMLKIDHPDDGFDVTFMREGAGRKTDYTAAQVVRKKSYLSDDDAEQEEWLALAQDNPLPSVINFYDYDYIAGVFSGASSKSEDEDDDESPPPRSRRRASTTEDADEEPPRRRRRMRSEEDSEVEDEEKKIDDPDESLDEDDDEKPRRRSRGGDLRDEVSDGLKGRRRRARG